ncbi:hypothetical protein CL634_07360 [bacterium]|nr:hypothetical protein [bacterium]
MRAVVLGIGRMGTAIAWAMGELGYEVVGMDANMKALRNMPEGNPRFVTVSGTEDIFINLVEEKKRGVDVVISSLPYHQTEEVGTWCVDNELRYCDLGGRVDVSAAINEWAGKKARKPVFTDLGLAPGWVNIIAEQARKQTHGAQSVEMYVGGLPRMQDSHNPLKYEATWSTDGLINEYRDDCLILENGEIRTVKGMEGYELVDFCGSGYEAFYTSGGAAHTIEAMKEAGVKNCSYKTLRYLGHRDIVRFLIRKCELSDEVLKDIFEKGCPQSVGGDRVLMQVKAKNGSLEWKKRIEILSDAHFSAMQKATAFPISCVASLMGEGKLEGDKEQHRDYWTQYPKALTYADVPYDELEKRLDILGLENFLD